MIIYYSNINALIQEYESGSKDHFERLISKISDFGPKTHDNIMAHKGIKDRFRSLAGILLLQKSFQDNHESDMNELLLSYKENGKPFFDKRRDISFSISHSGCLAICALSNGSTPSVGIDIQKHDMKLDSHKIANRFFDKKDNEVLSKIASNAAYDEISSSSYENAFYDMWTAKEAYIKYTGLGLSQSLNSFSCIPTSESAILPIDIFESGSITAKVHPVYLSSEYIADYSCSVCVSKNALDKADKLQKEMPAVFKAADMTDYILSL